MAHFWGYVSGAAKHWATRTGTKRTGLLATAASWHGCVRVSLEHDEESGEDRFRVTQGVWKGEGIQEEIAHGIVGIPVQLTHNL